MTSVAESAGVRPVPAHIAAAVNPCEGHDDTVHLFVLAYWDQTTVMRAVRSACAVPCDHCGYYRWPTDRRRP